MEKITAYKISNGQVFEKIEDAEEVQKDIAFKEDVWTFVKDLDVPNSMNDIIGFVIIDHSDRLFEILNKLYNVNVVEK